MTLTCLTTAIGCLVLTAVGSAPRPDRPALPPNDPLKVMKCNDFTLTGDGGNPEWQKTAWHSLTKLDTAGASYPSAFKILYSSKGIYVLFEGRDDKISTKYDQDFQNLFDGDVFEVFFHPDTTKARYLEYEVNALNKELVLMVSQETGRFSLVKDFHYADLEKVKKMTRVSGGRAEMNGTISSWSAELFFPYSLLASLHHVPPVSGTVWHANFYRMDYDTDTRVKWSWMPIESSFHEFRKFGSIRFE